MRTRLALIAVVFLTACGFHLRGSYALPYDSLYIALPQANELRALLRRTISAATATRVVDNAKEAQATLAVVSDSQAKNILSLGSDGRVREFQLVRNFSFQVQAPDGRVLVPTSQLSIHRDITFSDAAVLSKESEEALLWRDIQNDLVQQILRRLAAAKPQPAAG